MGSSISSGLSSAPIPTKERRGEESLIYVVWRLETVSVDYLSAFSRLSLFLIRGELTAAAVPQQLSRGDAPRRHQTSQDKAQSHMGTSWWRWARQRFQRSGRGRASIRMLTRANSSPLSGRESAVPMECSVLSLLSLLSLVCPFSGQLKAQFSSHGRGRFVKHAG